MTEFIIEAVIFWVNGARADGVLALEPCNNGVQILVRRELRKGRQYPWGSAGGFYGYILTEKPYHGFQLNLFNFFGSYWIVFVIFGVTGTAIAADHVAR